MKINIEEFEKFNIFFDSLNEEVGKEMFKIDSEITIGIRRRFKYFVIYSVVLYLFLLIMLNMFIN